MSEPGPEFLVGSKAAERLKEMSSEVRGRLIEEIRRRIPSPEREDILIPGVTDYIATGLSTGHVVVFRELTEAEAEIRNKSGSSYLIADIRDVPGGERTGRIRPV